MPYVKTQPQLQRKGLAHFSTSTTQNVSGSNVDLAYAFENVRYNNSTDKIVKTSNSMLTLKQGYVYRVTAFLNSCTGTGAYNISIAIVDDTNTIYPTSNTMEAYSPTSSSNVIPNNEILAIIDATNGDKKVKLRALFVTPTVTVSIDSNNLHVQVEVLESYVPQYVDVLNCTRGIFRQSTNDYAIDVLNGSKYAIFGGNTGASLTIEQITDAQGVQNIGFNCLHNGAYYFSRGVVDKYALMIHTDTSNNNGFYFYATSSKGNSGSSITWGDPILAVVKNDNVFTSPLIYNATTSNGANVFVDSTGRLFRSTSSIKYKTDIQPIEADYAKKIYELRPVWYRSACDADRKDWSWYGLVAEEVAKVEPRLCTYNKDGEPEGVDYARLSVLLLKEIQLMREELDELKNKITEIEGKK